MPPPMLNFFLTGDWDEDHVQGEWTASTRPIIAEVEEAIEAAWAQMLARPGVSLFDGPMCRLESWEQRGQNLHLTLSPISYKPFVGTNLCNPHLADRFGENVLANPVGVSCALETADSFLLMGRRTATVAYYPDRVHPFAGALEPRDAGNPFQAVRRELAEELSLGAADLAEIRCCGIVEDVTLRQPELIFRVRSTRARAELEAKMDPAEHHAAFVIAATEAGVAMALENPELTPVAITSLLLWGRSRLRGEWFHERMKDAARCT